MTKTEITQLSYEIVGSAIKVHKTLGPGLLESVYEKCLQYELEKNGFEVKNQFAIEVIYETLRVATDLKIDLLVNNIIVIELKTVEKLLPVHKAFRKAARFINQFLYGQHNKIIKATC